MSGTKCGVYIGGIRISGSKIGHIQTIITPPISVEKIQNPCSYSSLECLLSKRFKPRQRIPYLQSLLSKQ